MNKKRGQLYMASSASFSPEKKHASLERYKWIHQKDIGFITFFLLIPNNTTPNDETQVVIESSWNLVILKC